MLYDNPLEFGATKPRERQRRDLRFGARPEGEFGPASGNHHQRQRLTKADDPFEPFLRRRIGPVHVFEYDEEGPAFRPPTKETVEECERAGTPLVGRQGLALLRGFVAHRGELCQEVAVTRRVLDRVGEQCDKRFQPSRWGYKPLEARDLAERLRDAVQRARMLVWRTLEDEHRLRGKREPLAERAHDARFADPRLTGNDGDLAFAHFGATQQRL